MIDGESTKEAVECAHCGNKTQMTVVAEGNHQESYGYEDSLIMYYSFRILSCTNCKEFNIIQTSCSSEDVQIKSSENDGQSVHEDDIDSKVEYLYPLRKKIKSRLHFLSLNQKIEETYNQAQKCFCSGYYEPAILMCRKVLELLCLLFGVDDYNLNDKLKSLKKKGIIDEMLYVWADLLKSFGNDAAHTTKTFSKEDAEDTLDFTYAILEYCLEFRFRFERLLESKGGRRQVQKETEIKALVDSLNDPGSTDCIRYYAAICLAELEPEPDQVISTLISLLEQKNPIPKAAMSCLEQLGEKSVQELIELLANPDKSKDARVNAAKTIGRMGAKAEVSIPQLLSLLKDSTLNQEIGVEIVNALDRIGSKARATFVAQYSS